MTSTAATISGLTARDFVKQVKQQPAQSRLKVAEDLWHNLSVQQRNVYSYTSMITVLGGSGRIADALKLFAVMKASNVPPNQRTFTALIDGCAKSGNLLRARALFAEMRAEGIEPDRIACNVLINACAKAGDLKQALEVAQHVKDPDAITLNSLLACCERADEVRCAANAEMVWRMLQAAGTKPDSQSYACYLRCLKHDHQRFSAVFTEMAKLGILPDRISYNLALRQAAERGDVAKTRELLAEMKAAGIEANSHTFAALIARPRNPTTTAAQRPDRDMLVRMDSLYALLVRDFGLKPDAHAFNMRLNAYVDAGDNVGAGRVWAEMLEQGVKPNNFCFMTHLKAARSLEEATRRLDEMNAGTDERPHIFWKRWRRPKDSRGQPNSEQ